MNPADSLQLLERYSVVILPALVVAEQIGIPLPAVPALLGVGALAAHGRASISLVLGAIAIVALAVDFGWYELGRRRGASVLTRLCRVSLEPDSCVRRAENVFVRHGARGMLVAKFVPGLTTVMPPLAGIFAVGRARFGLYDLGGVAALGGHVDGARIRLQRCHRAGHRPRRRAGARGRPRRRDGARRLHPGQVPASPAVPARPADRPHLARRAEGTARRRGRHRDHRPPDAARRGGHAVCHPGESLVDHDAIDAHEAELLRARELVLYCS